TRNVRDCADRSASEVKTREQLSSGEVVHSRSRINQIERHGQVVIDQNLAPKSTNVSGLQDHVAWQLARDRKGNRLRVRRSERIINSSRDCEPASGQPGWERCRKLAKPGRRQQQARRKVIRSGESRRGKRCQNSRRVGDRWLQSE